MLYAVIRSLKLTKIAMPTQETAPKFLHNSSYTTNLWAGKSFKEDYFRGTSIKGEVSNPNK